MDSNERAKEIADKIDVNHFNKRLQDNTHTFLQLLKQKKSDLTKGDLISLLKYLVKYPDIDGQLVNGNAVELARLGGENKDLVVALTVQVLMEEGQRKATPKFKPKGE
jgi:hypothetical protein